MDMTNLFEKWDVLKTHLHLRCYSESYIWRITNEYNWIQKHAPGNTWGSYLDIYEQRVQGYKGSERTLYDYRMIYALLQSFDNDGLLPDGRHNKPLTPRGSYGQLCPEFKEIVDFAEASETARGIDFKNVGNMKAHLSCFFSAMQERNCSTVENINEEDVLSFFLDFTGDDVKLLRGRSYMRNVRTMLTASLAWHDGECQKLLDYLPETKGVRNNVQYLTEDEVEAIKQVLDEGQLSKRDTAMVSLLLTTGMRASDVTGLKVSSIDWETELIKTKQQKTGSELTLPLTPKVGNRIYEYMVSERPKVESEYVFLTLKAPYQRMQPASLCNVTNKLFDKAKIRLDPGSRRGCHIFRYHVATKMLESGVPAPVISATIGQDHFASLNPYIQGDLVHLKECTLSVSEFSATEGVFGDEED